MLLPQVSLLAQSCILVTSRPNRSLETSQLLMFYEAQLALLEQLAQTRVGAMHVLEAGLFEAVKESQLFATDPDIGLGRILVIPSACVLNGSLSLI